MTRIHAESSAPLAARRAHEVGRAAYSTDRHQECVADQANDQASKWTGCSDPAFILGRMWLTLDIGDTSKGEEGDASDGNSFRFGDKCNDTIRERVPRRTTRGY